jgi:hypothetical protein
MAASMIVFSNRPGRFRFGSIRFDGQRVNFQDATIGIRRTALRNWLGVVDLYCESPHRPPDPQCA